LHIAPLLLTRIIGIHNLQKLQGSKPNGRALCLIPSLNETPFFTSSA